MRFDEYIITRLVKAGFKPWQPRVPAGNGRTSGRWSDDNGINLYQPANGPLIVALIAKRAAAKLIQLGWNKYAKRIGSTRWILGEHKSAVRWLNRIGKRNFTPEKVTKLKLTAPRSPVENRVNRQNPASIYRDPVTEDFIIVDDVTDEILQIGDKKMDAPLTLNSIVKTTQQVRDGKW